MNPLNSLLLVIQVRERERERGGNRGTDGEREKEGEWGREGEAGRTGREGESTLSTEEPVDAAAAYTGWQAGAGARNEEGNGDLLLSPLFGGAQCSWEALCSLGTGSKRVPGGGLNCLHLPPAIPILGSSHTHSVHPTTLELNTQERALPVCA